ncbi:MAG: hypothetical protein Q9162_003618 [Coniocarpon cinnabarinum]
MYLATSNIPVDSKYTFPRSLGPLRHALQKTEEILHCAKCNGESRVAIKRQNTSFVLTLLGSLGCGFDRLLRDIDAEAQSCLQKGEKKAFELGDRSAESAHLHTGSSDCPMRVEIELEASEWRDLAFRAVKTHVNDIGDGKLTLEGVINAMELRQRTWHAAAENISSSTANGGRDSQAASCVQLAQNVRVTIAEMPT